MVLDTLRKSLNVPLRSIRSAIERTRSFFETDHPLSDLHILTDRRDVFIEQFGEYLNLSRDGQIEMRTELEKCMHKLEKDTSGIPIKLFPMGNPGIIEIDPRINFGRPSISGCGIPTEVLFERFSSGENIDFLATDYQCSPVLIRQAIEYEESSRKRAA
jgi:uncharacterized protein (DUF433 family)